MQSNPCTLQFSLSVVENKVTKTASREEAVFEQLNQKTAQFAKCEASSSTLLLTQFMGSHCIRKATTDGCFLFTHSGQVQRSKHGGHNPENVVQHC